MTLVDLVAPQHYWVPDYHQTFGPEMVELSRVMNFPADPEQALCLDAIGAVDKRGMSVAFEVAVIACRQNLKTGLVKIAAIGKTVVMERPLFVWSAHEFRTSQEAFRDLTILIESCPDLDQMVKRIYRGNGDESIEWLGGQRIIFKARTKAGGRGLTGDDVGLDEAFALLPSHMGALLPTLSARPDPQVLYASSAGLEYSEVLRSVRDRGRAKNEPRLAYIEWCAPDPVEACERGVDCDHGLDIPGCGCDKPELWQHGNPALGRRISVEYIAAERRALPPVEFGRERMGWWDDPSLFARIFDSKMWGDLGDPASTIAGTVHLAVEVAQDQSWACIAAAGQRLDGKAHVQVVEYRPGTAWVAAKLLEFGGKAPTVTLAPNTPAGSLIEPLKAARVKVETVTQTQYAQACGAMFNRYRQDQLRHLKQRELDVSVEGAKRRPVGDAWVFDRRTEDVDISPLAACTLALHAAFNRPRNTGSGRVLALT